MGQYAADAYAIIGKIKSLEGKMALATKTRIPSTKAPLEPDTPELKAMFDKAFREITGMTIADARKVAHI
jgi:hypothetical protein